jgi:hypothetical protein
LSVIVEDILGNQLPLEVNLFLKTEVEELDIIGLVLLSLST